MFFFVTLLGTIYTLLFCFVFAQQSMNIAFAFFLGRATWTKHVRNGKELPEITRDNNYDFSFAVSIVM